MLLFIVYIHFLSFDAWFSSFDIAKISMILATPYHFLLISLHFVTTIKLNCDKPRQPPQKLSQEATFYNDNDDDNDDFYLYTETRSYFDDDNDHDNDFYLYTETRSYFDDDDDDNDD